MFSAIYFFNFFKIIFNIKISKQSKNIKKINFNFFKKYNFNHIFKYFLDNLVALKGDLCYLIAFSDFLGKKKKITRLMLGSNPPYAENFPSSPSFLKANNTYLNTILFFLISLDAF